MSAADPNRDLVRRIFEEAWNTASFGCLDGRIAATVPFTYNGTTFRTSADELPGLVATWRTAFPDLHVDIRHLVAQEELVAVSLVLTGTHRGTWSGVPPTGARVEVEEMMFFRFDGTTLVEMWEVFDESSLRSQLTAGG